MRIRWHSTVEGWVLLLGGNPVGTVTPKTLMLTAPVDGYSAVFILPSGPVTEAPRVGYTGNCSAFFPGERPAKKWVRANLDGWLAKAGLA